MSIHKEDSRKEGGGRINRMRFVKRFVRRFCGYTQNLRAHGYEQHRIWVVRDLSFLHLSADRAHALSDNLLWSQCVIQFSRRLSFFFFASFVYYRSIPLQPANCFAGLHWDLALPSLPTNHISTYKYSAPPQWPSSCGEQTPHPRCGLSGCCWHCQTY